MIGFVFAVALLAQQDSTTTCSQIGNQTRCETRQQQSGFEAYNRARERSATEGERDADLWRGLGEAMRARGRADSADADRRAIAQRNNLRHSVGAMIDAGLCDDAISAALRAGDLELAASARSYCASQVIPAGPPSTPQ